jgi:hypothetical protein
MLLALGALAATGALTRQLAHADRGRRRHAG